MKTNKAGIVLFLGAVAAVCGQESAQGQLHLYPAEPWNTNMTHQVVWETGLRDGLAALHRASG